MCELQWDPLAELYLSRVDWPEEVYCLCSRVFVRSKEDKTKNSVNQLEECTASESEFCKDDEYLEDPTDTCHQISSDVKLDVSERQGDVEVVSCYCSASHTDNISTDEHDSLRDSHSTRIFFPKGLQPSDSGADLTEHIKNDPEAAWHKFWTTHGEQLIWDSWITKYSDYINPGYLTQCETDEKSESKDGIEISAKPESSTKFSFEKKDLDKVEVNLSIIDEDKVLKPSVDLKLQESGGKRTFTGRNLSMSDSFDKLNTDISEGWNPLSPISLDCETEAERLLSSRCGSYASSSVRTVDSMTNVTRMTVSSIDFSDSSKNSDSFSSVSSVQSSISSTSSEEGDDNADFDAQWNLLWKKHYEDEYLEQYKKFMSIHSNDIDHTEIKKDEVFTAIVNKINLETIKSLVRRSSNNSSVDESENTSKKSSKQKRLPIKSLEAIEQLLSNCKMEDDGTSENVFEERRTDSKDSNNISIDEEMQFEGQEEDALAALGLPTSFGNKKKNKISNKSVESKSDQSTSDRIKAAFNLMGIELHENISPKFKGQVDYKMKHIRLQNRHLKLHSHAEKSYKRKHIFFDDDGNEIPTDEPSDEMVMQSSLTDTSENKQSSSSNDEEEYTKNSPDKSGEEDFESLHQSRKRKRKRKLALPPEIKSNPKLRKYWHRRFSLFHKFDQGIKLDEESWYSVTPEQVAMHTAQRCQCDIIVDAFCGAGGNSIQFAYYCERVIAIDIDPKKIELAQNNAKVYGVADRIEFIVGDFFELAKSLKADAVFLSPPWGGPAYLSLPTYELEEMLQPVPLSKLLVAAKQISSNIALFLPKNSNTYPLLESAGPGGYVEIEQNFINKHLVAITAYYNDLIKRI